MSESNDPLHFYTANGDRRGPFTFEQLLQQPVHRQMPVWTKGMPDWQPAQDVPGLAGLIPPPPPMAGPNTPAGSNAIGPDLNRYAVALRQLNIGILCVGIGTILLALIGGELHGYVYAVAALATLAILWKTAEAVPVQRPWLWAVVGVLPLVSYLPLMILHSRLKQPLLAAGYRVGFLGSAVPPARVGV